jgi:hypothetical protein
MSRNPAAAARVDQIVLVCQLLHLSMTGPNIFQHSSITPYTYGRVDNIIGSIKTLIECLLGSECAGHACVEGSIAIEPTKRIHWASASLHLNFILHLAAWAFFHQSGFLRRPFYSDAPWLSTFFLFCILDRRLYQHGALRGYFGFFFTIEGVFNTALGNLQLCYRTPVDLGHI